MTTSLQVGNSESLQAMVGVLREKVEGFEV